MGKETKTDQKKESVKAFKAKAEEYTQKLELQNVKKEIVKTEQYDLFTLVKKDRKVYVAVGNNIVTHSTFDRVEQAKKYIDSKPWDLILNTCAVMQSMLAQMEQQTNK